MKIQLKDYQLQEADARMRTLVSRERGLVHDASGYDYYATKQIRALSGCRFAVRRLGRLLVRALSHLPYTEGGTARPSGPNGEWIASLDDIDIGLPLVQALLIVRAHPSFGVFEPIDFRHGNQPGMGGVNRDGTKDEQIEFIPGGPYDAAQRFDRLFVRHSAEWSYEALLATVSKGAFAAFGEQAIESTWLPDQVFPGSRISMYATIWYYAMLYSAAGALDPGYARADALSGEWWLVQPVSPRLVHDELASRFELALEGYLPPGAVDVRGRVVMACYPREEMEDSRRVALLRDNKFVAGFQKVSWARDRFPLDQPGFELVGRLEWVTAESYGPYRHSSELPAWPGDNVGADVK